MRVGKQKLVLKIKVFSTELSHAIACLPSLGQGRLNHTQYGSLTLPWL